jgi:hypothetical protein
MMCNHSYMYQRINITLPNETLQLLDRIAPKGDLLMGYVDTQFNLGLIEL